jgi:hypothetical protein
MLLTDPTDPSQLKLLEDRFVEGAGFSNRLGERARPDVTCWAILALQAAGRDSDTIPKARRLLANAQNSDGRVWVSPLNPDACWPTPLAVLAWLKAPEYEAPRKKAIRFLLDLEEIQLPSAAEVGDEHGTTIKGWPWIAKTYPWVEPTAYGLMAMRAAGYLIHNRTSDAIHLLLDRQLPSGGWNYGNTLTFGKEMRPMPESTGVALAALTGLTPKATVERSIAYLRSQLPYLNTPMSLSWAIMSFHAWQEPLDQPKGRILGVLARQNELGPYDTVSLSWLLLAYYCNAGLVHFLEAR